MDAPETIMTFPVESALSWWRQARYHARTGPLRGFENEDNSFSCDDGFHRENGFRTPLRSAA